MWANTGHIKIATISPMVSSWDSCITPTIRLLVLLAWWAGSRCCTASVLTFSCLAATSTWLVTMTCTCVAVLILRPGRCLYRFFWLRWGGLLLKAHLFLANTVFLCFARVSAWFRWFVCQAFIARWVGAQFRYRLIAKTGRCLNWQVSRFGGRRHYFLTARVELASRIFGWLL